MRLDFEREKSRDVKRKHGVSQFRAIGCCDGRLCSVIFETKYDSEGEYYRLVTAWKATKEEEQSYAQKI